MKKSISVLCIIMILFNLSGCYDLSETNDMVYAAAIGIDKGTQNNYDITIQYARVFEINSGAEGGKGDTEILDTVTVNAPGIYSAVELANHLVSKRFMLSHIKLIVFSAEVAKDGLGDFKELFMRNSDLRPYVFMAVAQTGAREYLEAVKPSIDINPVKYYDLIYNNKSSVYVPYFDLHEFCSYFNTAERDIVMPAASAAFIGTQNMGTENKSGFEYNTENYIAGHKSSTSDSASEVIGMAVFADDRLAGMMGSHETELYNMLIGKFNMNYTTFYSPITDKPITVKITQDKRPVVKTNISDNDISAEINLYFESEFVGLPDNYSYENELNSFETAVSGYIKSAAEEFLKRTQSEFNSDVLGIGTHIKKKFRTYDEWKNYNFNEKYKDVKFNVNVEYKLRRTGHIIRKN